MKKVLLVNGSPHEKGCTFTALNEVKTALGQEGAEAEILWLGTKPVAGCIACGKCRANGRCVFDDAVNRTIERLPEFGAIVLGSPVYYAGPSGQICAFADRLFNAGAAFRANSARRWSVAGGVAGRRPSTGSTNILRSTACPSSPRSTGIRCTAIRPTKS